MRVLNKLLFAVSMFFVPLAANSAEIPPYFVGTLKLGPHGCKQTAECTVLSDFGFVDKRKVGWLVPGGEKTDGASIPKITQFLVGTPFREEYLNAAILHDHYSKSVRPVRSWFSTQRMFYEALLLTGVSSIRSATLYAGVLLGAPKWIRKMKGTSCNLGAGVACQQNAGEIVLTKLPDTYGAEDFLEGMKVVRSALDQNANLTLDEIEKLVRPYLPDPVYLDEKDGLVELPNRGGVTE